MATPLDPSFYTASASDIKHMTGLGLESNISTASEDKIFYYHRGIKNVSSASPILVLIHGYPQSNFMWRHIVPLLPSNIPLYIPDIPGYGRSTPLSTPHSKRNTGTAILNHLLSLLPPSSSPIPLLIAGHDRGARISHRLAVDFTCSPSPFPAFNLLGSILLDIVPTLTQWSSFSSPQNSAGTFHWPFLANASIASSLIKAQGGDIFTLVCLERWSGGNEACKKRFREHDAWEVYANAFKQERVIDAACDDYRAGAEEDVREQEEDQREGRKIDGDVLVVFSEGYLGSRYDLKKVWGEWVGKGRLELKGVGDGCGHFIPEENPEVAARVIGEFYEEHREA